MVPGMDDIAHNLIQVKTRIADAAKDSGRSPEEVTLVAITKVHSADHIRPALEAGHRIFGENRLQESATKWPDLKAEFPEARLHLVGPLQRNKVRRAVALFDAIQTVDRPKLAGALADEMTRADRRPDCFIQVNTGEEAQKSGVHPAHADAFIADCRDRLELPVVGLMCIPPVDEEPSLHFALLSQIAERNGLTGLSMGMSDDFEIAVRFGATHVRVGTAVFGPRPPNIEK